VTFREDLSRLRTGHGANNMAVVRHFALNLVRQVADKRSIRRRRKRAAWDPHYWTDSMEPISSNGRNPDPTDLILRSAPLGARLEGWPLARPRLWPSFETRARGALLWTRLMHGVDMIRTSETLYYYLLEILGPPRPRPC
jgi:hypothetical protein